MSAIRSVHVRISGRVQGVGFRAWTRAPRRRARPFRLGAKQCGRRRWRRCSAGPADAVDAMLDRLPRGAALRRVEARSSSSSEAEPAIGPFTIRSDR